MARINEAMAMSHGQAPLGNYDSNFVQAPLAESPAPATVLADTAALQETVRSHGTRMTGLETTLAAGFHSMRMLRRIHQKFEAATFSPVRSSGPPRRSFGPRRNLQEATCYACGQKGHYARDCKGASFSTLPSRKQEEITGALNNAPLGDFAMAVVYMGAIRSFRRLPKPRRFPGQPSPLGYGCSDEHPSTVSGAAHQAYNRPKG